MAVGVNHSWCCEGYCLEQLEQWRPPGGDALPCSVAKLRPTLWLSATPWTVWSLPGSCVHGIFQARILEWVAIPSPEDLPHPGIECASPALAGGFFTIAPPGKPLVGGGARNSKTSPNPPQSHTYFFLNPVIWGCCAKECSTMKGLAPWVKGRMLRISSADDIETYKNYVKILCNIWGSYENGEPGKLFAKKSAGKMGWISTSISRPLTWSALNISFWQNTIINSYNYYHTAMHFRVYN